MKDVLHPYLVEQALDLAPASERGGVNLSFARKVLLATTKTSGGQLVPREGSHTRVLELAPWVAAVVPTLATAKPAPTIEEARTAAMLSGFGDSAPPATTKTRGRAPSARERDRIMAEGFGDGRPPPDGRGRSERESDERVDERLRALGISFDDEA